MTRITRTTGTAGAAGATALRAGLTVAAFAASGALLLTACSSSSGSSSSASASGSPAATASASASASGNRGQDMTAYRDCLSQHGLKLPSFAPRSPGARPSGSPGAGRGFGGGGFGGGGGRGFGGGGFPGFGGATPDAATQKALDACKSLRPQFSGRGGANGGANASAFKAFTSCLKDHGVVLPTPSPGATNGAGRPGGGFGFRGLNTSDPKTAKAYDACKVLLPQRNPGSGTGAPSPSATT